MWEVGHLGGNVSGNFFGKGRHLQKESSGGVEGLAGTTMQLVAVLCSTAVVSPETWAWVFGIRRALGGVGGTLA